jgi:integrase
LLPIAPEFEEFLISTPPEERVGYVFTPLRRRNRVDRITTDTACRVISNIGKAAGVVVSEKPFKHASAHDLRRSFGERMARVPEMTPQMLMELMRHASIETTMKYYVGRNAQATANALWASYERRLGTQLGTRGQEESQFSEKSV